MICAHHICSIPSADPNFRTLGGCPIALWVTCGPKEKGSEQAPFLKSLLSSWALQPSRVKCPHRRVLLSVGRSCPVHGSAGASQVLQYPCLRDGTWPNVGRRNIQKAPAPEGILNCGPGRHLKPVCSSEISGVIIKTQASHLGKSHS